MRSSPIHLNHDSGGVVERKAGGEGAAAILMQRNQMTHAQGAVAAVAAVASAVMAKSVRHRQVGKRCQREAGKDREERAAAGQMKRAEGKADAEEKRRRGKSGRSDGRMNR